jgi:hypothetical protein
MGKFIDLAGQKFGRLTVVEYLGKNKYTRTIWKCKCDCGGSAICTANNLTRNNSKSCGCIAREAVIQRNYKHGKYGTSLYITWYGMKARCLNKNNPAFNDYGGRGITICNEWIGSFESFYNWAIGNGYKEGLTIDRIDVNGNYEPDNCRWTTMEIQQNNRRDNRIMTIDGFTASLADICRKYNVKYKKVWKRLYLGWTLENAIIKN